MTSDVTRLCRKCGVSRRLPEDFHSVNTYKGRKYYRHTCKRCYHYQWNPSPEQKAIYKRKGRVHRWRADGVKITLDQHDRIFAIQGGVCAICGGVNQSGRALHVDHDHITGVVRGLLCGRCNTGIGCFRDNTDHIERAAQYLERYQ